MGDIGLAVRDIRAGAPFFGVVRRYKLRPSELLEALPLSSLPGMEGRERPTDRGQAALQLMVLRSCDVLWEALEDTSGMNEKMRVEVARDILNRNSYLGVKRVAVATRVSLAPEVMERLVQVESALRGTRIEAPATIVEEG
jgi:hypothetical protein